MKAVSSPHPRIRRSPQARMRQRLNVWLYRRGIRLALLRRVLCIQSELAAVCTVSGLALWPLTHWIFWCGIGALLSLWNFFSLTKLAPQLMVRGYSSASGMAFFLRTQGRIILTLGAGMACVVFVKAPLGALLVGLSLSMVVIVWAVFTARRTPR